MNTTTILLIALITLCTFSALFPKKNYEISFKYAVVDLISFFINAYITYYLFNALDFGFTLTYTQVMFIYLLAGKADLFKSVKRIKEINDFKNKNKDNGKEEI